MVLCIDSKLYICTGFQTDSLFMLSFQTERRSRAEDAPRAVATRKEVRWSELCRRAEKLLESGVFVISVYVCCKTGTVIYGVE